MCDEEMKIHPYGKRRGERSSVYPNVPLSLSAYSSISRSGPGEPGSGLTIRPSRGKSSVSMR